MSRTGEVLRFGDRKTIDLLAVPGRVGDSGGVRWLEMFDLDVDPVPLFMEVFGDETTVTVVRLVLATKETGVIEEFRWELIFDFAGSHQGAEGKFIGFPRPLPFLEFVEDVLGRSELGQMQVVDLAYFAQEIPEVALLGKAGELRPVVQASIDQRADTRLFELGEEGLGALVGKADGV